MASYLILGAGKFGGLALGRLAGQDPAGVFWMVDLDPEALDAVRARLPAGARLAAQDAIAFLRGRLGNGTWDWLIPMVPVHVAFAYVAADPRVEEDWEAAPVPEAVARGLAVAHRGARGELFLSRAAHRCPDNCRAGEVCPVSGESREIPLHEQLRTFKAPGFEMKVVVSRQLAPGVGGYPPRELEDLAAGLAGCRTGVLIATACRCHGVVHGLRRRGASAPKRSAPR